MRTPSKPLGTPGATTAPQRTTPVRPASASVPSPSPAKTIGITGAAKRVSINTPVHEGGDAAGKIFARTPYAKSAGKDMSDGDDTQMEAGSLHGDEGALLMDGQAGVTGEQQRMVDAEDALMALAAALPPSSRPTQEEVVVTEPAAATSPLAAAPSPLAATPMVASSQVKPGGLPKSLLNTTPKVCNPSAPAS